MAAVVRQDVPETEAWQERQLHDGTVIHYRLRVIQQPERARACGMGAKSHADRRPVDPPPVVELCVFQGGPGDEKQDITFSYNSNFFLFATLEHARNIAQGRMPATAAQSPVLTGVPVSGMAYLDRPAPAGYFIFPDLSVRHEGQYRLHFALFEEAKEGETEPNVMQMPINQPQIPTQFVYHRVEVKTQAFTVFSAKKFPGLSESTVLSRVVAEQGCRVRIRRDVRMRRKPNGKGDRGDPSHIGQGEYVRRGATEDAEYPQEWSNSYNGIHPPQIPQDYVYNMENRKRSDSNASQISVNDAPSPSPAQYPAPRDYAPHPQMPMPQDPNRYYQNAPPPQQTRNGFVPSQGYGQSPHMGNGQAPHRQQPQYMPPQYPQPMHHDRRTSGEYHDMNRRDTKPYAMPQRPPTPTQYMQSHADNGYYSQVPSHQYAPPPQQQGPPTPLPPLRIQLPAIEPSRGYTANSPAATTPGSSLPPTAVQSASMAPSQPHYYASQTAHPPMVPASPWDQQIPVDPNVGHNKYSAPVKAGTKRSYDRVFNTSHMTARNVDGMRPDPTYQGAEIDDDEDDFGNMKMSYRRACGDEVVRTLDQV